MNFNRFSTNNSIKYRSNNVLLPKTSQKSLLEFSSKNLVNISWQSSFSEPKPIEIFPKFPLKKYSHQLFLVESACTDWYSFASSAICLGKDQRNNCTLISSRTNSRAVIAARNNLCFTMYSKTSLLWAFFSYFSKQFLSFQLFYKLFSAVERICIIFCNRRTCLGYSWQKLIKSSTEIVNLSWVFFFGFGGWRLLWTVWFFLSRILFCLCFIRS